jgi:hypothetical protein
VPLEGTGISVTQLLPSSVTITGGSAFALSIAPVTFSTSLGDLCPACAAFNGQVVPKPAFTGTFSDALTLPPDVAGGTLTGGWVRFAATNGFSFDPLRPGGGQTGTLTVRVLADGALIGSQVISGAQRAWPAGSTLTDSVAVAGAGTTFSVDVTISSPAGSPTAINTNSGISVTATPVRLLLSDARVQVHDRQVSGQPVQLDLTGIDDFIVDRVEGGQLVFTITNGFAVGGSMTLTVAGATLPITKEVELPATDATVAIALTEAELESMLGRVVTVVVTGLVSATAPVLVTPASAFDIAALLVLELGPPN